MPNDLALTETEKLEQFARECWHELAINRNENRLEVCAVIGRGIMNGSLESAMRSGWTPKLWANHYGPAVDPSFRTSTLVRESTP